MEYPKTTQNTIKRAAHKAVYDKAVVHEILDASDICSVAFCIDGKAFVQPINFGRKGEMLYLHGSVKNRMTSVLLEAGEVSLTVMVLDSMKLTRSAYHHSVNYRSVVVFGNVRELVSDEEKLTGLKTIINHFVPGRWDHCRHPNKDELKATRVVEIAITSASAKIADSPLAEKKDDYALDYWAGEIPVKTTYGYPVSDGQLKEGIEIPRHVMDFYEKHTASF